MTLGLQRFFLIAGVLCLGAWASDELASRVFQRYAEARLADASGGGPRSERARAEAASSGVIGRIRVPRLGLSAMVGEGIDDRTLARAVGHLPGTPFPGENGNVALAGHRDTFFRKLRRIQKGDTIRVTTPDGEFRYRVHRILVVPPTAVEVLRETPTPTLTLVTCYPFRSIGPAPDRFVVQARALPGGRTTQPISAS